MKNLSDAQLLEKFWQKQDNASLGELYQRYMPLLYGLCLKYLKNRDDAKDMVMQIFEKLNEKLPQQKQIENFKSWLYIFARNECLMQLRKDKNVFFQENTENLMENMQELHLDIEAKEQQEQALELLEKGLDALSEEQEKCIRLFYLEKKSYQDIAKETGYTMLQVKSYIQNGKRNLKNFMEK
ncbi:MAG: sigma-70 family RNA polymerase sigma factor [Raineya sp.]